GLAFQGFQREGELAAVLAGDTRREGVAREGAAHVQEGRLAFGAFCVTGLCDLATDHAALADRTRRHFRRDHGGRLGESGGGGGGQDSGRDERKQGLHRGYLRGW